MRVIRGHDTRLQYQDLPIAPCCRILPLVLHLGDLVAWLLTAVCLDQMLVAKAVLVQRAAGLWYRGPLRESLEAVAGRVVSGLMGGVGCRHCPRNVPNPAARYSLVCRAVGPCAVAALSVLDQVVPLIFRVRHRRLYPSSTLLCWSHLLAPIDLDSMPEMLETGYPEAVRWDERDSAENDLDL